MRLTSSFSILALLSAVLAHPGEIEEHDTPAKHEFLRYAQRSIADCKQPLYLEGYETAAVQRRANLAKVLREERGLPSREFLDKRDFETVLNTSHHSNKTNLSLLSPSKDIFTGELQCVLQSETTEGPYYVKGELIRTNIRERQKGIPLYIDYQIVDVNTCKPVPNVHLDSWHTNATGVYAGVVARGNGNINDLSNINATFARGITKTDRHGVTFLETLFPGHYTGRTTHIHVLVTVNATVARNGTLIGGNVAHVGQVFFDQDLINKVEAYSPYTTNQQPLLLNKDDFIFAEEAASSDPVLNYVWLGSKPTDGILAWITIGIDTKASYNPSAAVFWTKNGGVVNPDAPSGPPGGPGGPGGPPPSGFPTGLPPPSSTVSATSDPTSTSA
ncbi:hypothetical protein JR316_0006765 [Psilocybe cubensis]|uniref:Uncharacterized protein n=2 Tax=Psilocybe cubensis TaxID=181762 RepID=A0ACB8GXK4_PSICU|nr:hypothetical protein JR316_0006765 [Psilocybe cubensis]KAH9480167.1 hypothetical protein JR316_0006765 [Psilocybe cubensis]